jgi:hypothetical protein
MQISQGNGLQNGQAPQKPASNLLGYCLPKQLGKKNNSGYPGQSSRSRSSNGSELPFPKWQIPVRFRAGVPFPPDFNPFLHLKSDTASDTILRFYSKSGPITANGETKLFRDES